MYDAIVVGSGPNGLAAAITLAQAGRSVLMLEQANTVGGGMRTSELTLPGFRHDVCSAIHPLGLGSPFLRALPLSEHGLEWIQPDVPLAHPFDGEPPALLERPLEPTAAKLGPDAGRYRRLVGPLVTNADALLSELLAPLRLPRHPLLLARFGARALLPSTLLARRLFRGERARGLFAGLAAHSMLPLTQVPSAAVGLILATLGHTVGWPLAKGGSQSLADALGSYLRSLGGEIDCGQQVDSLDQLPETRLVLFDLTPRQLIRIAGERLPSRYRHRLAKYRYGPGVFKLDLALDGPIPWRNEECARAGTVHLGGTLDEIVDAEAVVAARGHPERPFVLLAQPSLFDPSRAPTGKHTAWAYCHVPNGSDVDMTEPIEAQIERFAPGFRDLILARHTFGPAQLEHYNPNYIGGDINGGLQDLRQLYTRPLARRVPYSTPVKGLYICSSSTPPGGGVHGMCGYHAAQAALRRDSSPSA
jgi:phytoene dehydrogenase-like protein